MELLWMLGGVVVDLVVLVWSLLWILSRAFVDLEQLGGTLVELLWILSGVAVDLPLRNKINK